MKKRYYINLIFLYQKFADEQGELLCKRVDWVKFFFEFVKALQSGEGIGVWKTATGDYLFFDMEEGGEERTK